MATSRRYEPVGRVVAGFLMVGGMFFLALFAGIVGHTMLHAVLTIREEAFRMSSIIDHVVICGYEPGTRLLLDAIEEEFDPEQPPRDHLRARRAPDGCAP